MAERARLESVYTLIAYRGFESLSLRHIHKKTGPNGLFFYGCGAEAGLEPTFDNIVRNDIERPKAAPKG